MELQPTNQTEISIEPNRRLLKSSSNSVREFYSPDIDSRVISLPARGENALTHEELVEFRLPVFSAMYRDDELWITIPDDSRSLKKNLRFIARDIHNYGEIFYKLGSVYRQLDSTGIGFPEATDERSVLESMVFSLEENEPYGGNVHLIPPYTLNQVTPEQAMGSIAIELEYSRIFADSEVKQLYDTMKAGFENG
jgi:hypothetical protein